MAQCGQSTSDVLQTEAVRISNMPIVICEQRRFDMLMWHQVYCFRHMNENDVRRRRFDPRDSCSTSGVGSRTCQVVETLLFSHFPW